ncbi:hypothetical protein ACFQ1M_13840 [Sungkyunkwania multivorans]|uniref:DUF4381 domain-containing protein n=1 Tax=Sungkyunkwania multivorans TaxID=1173618 RepID=A0ABW3D0A8_9FLAO
MRKLIVLCFMLFTAIFGFAQSQPKVSSSIDSTRIKIAEQFNYTINVETDSTEIVTFPKNQAFAPFEVIEDHNIDTIRENARFNLIKKYGLTQWDSGYYKLRSQKVGVGGKIFLTDSAFVEVTTIKVDTVSKEFFDIKPLVAVEKSYEGWLQYLLWGLFVLLVIGGLLYWFVFRQKPLTKEEKIALLPPYDRALLKLKELETSRYILQSEHKKYYSELTDIVRSYLEEEANVTALESTTDQLIEKLELLSDAGQLDLDKQTVTDLKNVLKNADLVKFAKAQPEMKVAEADRRAIEGVVIQTHRAIPEPTEEDLMQNEEYLAELLAKKRKKRIVIASVVGTFLLLAIVGGSIAFYGWNYVKDNIFGHPTKELLEGEWVRSEYGTPPIILETPKVLKRKSVPVPSSPDNESQGPQGEIETFFYGSVLDNFYMAVSSYPVPKEVEIDLNTVSELSVKMLEEQGAENLIVKKDEFSLASGASGLKTYGRGEFVNKDTQKRFKTEYSIYLFKEKEGIQLVMLVYQRDDAYAKDIVERITNSISFKTGA